MRILAAIAALCAVLAAFILHVDRRHAKVLDPRRASWRTIRNSRAICVAAIVFLAWAGPAWARPSPYPPVTPFVGDRYSAQTQLGPEVTRGVNCPPPCIRGRTAKGHKKRGTASHRQKWQRGVPLPTRRPPIAEPGSVDSQTMWGGFSGEVTRGVARILGGRPAGCPARAWCGCWLAQYLGISNRSLWLARNWAAVGSDAGGPAPGVIVVWRHHVGIITGRAGAKWIVKSGNDGRAVRERPRSIAGAIAYRRRA